MYREREEKGKSGNNLRKSRNNLGKRDQLL